MADANANANFNFTATLYTCCGGGRPSRKLDDWNEGGRMQNEIITASHMASVASADTWFASLPAELAQRLLKEGLRVELAQGARLFARGDAPDGVYCIVFGVMRITYITEDGREALLAMLEPPQWFGEIALFDNKNRTHDAWAETEAVLLHVPQPALLHMLEDEPRWWKAFGQLLTQKLRVTFAAMEETFLLSPGPRVAGRLAAMAGGYGSWQGRSKRVLDVSQEQLGLMVALSRQTVNQALKELESGGMIRRSRGSIEVLDLARLQAYGNGPR